MKSKGEIVLICAIIGFVAALALMFPKAREFLFGGGETQEASGPGGEGGLVALDAPRNLLPMGEYTQFFKKMQFTIDADGVKRHQVYYWFAPPKPYPPGHKYPLVVFLHDRDGKAPGAVYLRLKENFSAFPAFVLIPQAPKEKTWASPARFSGQEFPPPSVTPPVSPPELQVLPDIIELMARIAVAYPIDESRLYIAGCDEGGAGVYGAAANYGGIFAGGVVMGGAWSYLDGPKIAKTPLLLLHGAQDTVVPPELPRAMREIIKRYGGTVFSHEFRGLGHDCSSPHFYSQPVWKWLFSQRRAAPAMEVVATPAR
jgi:predicted peptidase